MGRAVLGASRAGSLAHGGPSDRAQYQTWRILACKVGRVQRRCRITGKSGAIAPHVPSGGLARGAGVTRLRVYAL